MSGWDLAAPWALLFLPLPLLAMRVLPRRRGDSGGTLRVPVSLTAAFGQGRASAPVAADRRWLAWPIWIAIVVALAGPRTIVGAPAQPATGRDIVLALDLSGSMERTDFTIEGKPATRLAALKKIGTEFIRRRRGDRIGLVIFAENAYAVSPPSYDTAVVARLLDDAVIGLVGRSTAIGDGLGLALKRLVATGEQDGGQHAKSDGKVVVLLSDGANNTGTTSPTDVAKLAKSLGIKIHTIALGINDMASGSEDPDAVDSVTLKAVATISGGTAFRVRTTADLAAASRAIDALEPTLASAPPRVLRREAWIYPATLALLMVAGAMALGRVRA